MSPTQKYRSKVTGKRIISVTQALNVLNKPALVYWGYTQGLENFNKITTSIVQETQKQYNCVEDLEMAIMAVINDFEIGKLYDKRDKAADAGTLAHLFVENHLKKLPEPDVKDVQEDIKKKAEGSYLAFLEWETSHDFRMVNSELPLVSKVHDFGGTIDIGAVVNQLGIVDIKTSKGVYWSMLCQVSAYGHLYNENFPETPIQGYHILRLGQDGDFDHKFWPSLDDEWEVFLNCLNIAKMLEKKGVKL